jgi:hypothetical protein
MRTAKKRKRTAYDDPSLNKLALVIGHLCIKWAWIEEVLDTFIGNYAPLAEGHIQHAITSNLDIRNKIQILKALAFERSQSDEWFDNLSLLLNIVDNELRPERNKYVHGHWHRPEGKLHRTSLRISFKKVQAFQPISLTTKEQIRINLRDAQRFCERVERLFIDLFIVLCTPPEKGGPVLAAKPSGTASQVLGEVHPRRIAK